MKIKQVDGINIGLIILSAILAFNFPLQIFILSFAILGPLHYLTEINWLDKKRYFAPMENRLWLWIGISASILIFFPKVYFYINPEDTSKIGASILWFNSWTNGFIFITLLMAIGFTFFKSKINWLAIAIIGVFGALALNSNDNYATWIGIFVPTVIHVYIFTILFMLYGAMKAKSKLGYISVAVVLFIPIMFASINLDNASYEFSDTMKSIFLDNKLYATHLKVAVFFDLSDGTSFFFKESMELRLMMFFSFIYLYHYLNWFSKTSLIQWHKNLTIKNSIIITVMWIVMLALFYFNFSLGLIVGLFFSVLHVILEFPLNMVSIKGIFTSSKQSEN